MTDSDLSPDRPWEREPASNPGGQAPTEQKRGIGCGIGCGVVVLIVVVGAVTAAVVGANRTKGPCEEAQEAYVLATQLDDPHDREIAALQYAVKKAECDAQGGSDR